MDLATPWAFKSNPSRVWQFYHYRREACVLAFKILGTKLRDGFRALRASPNAAHTALAHLSHPTHRRKLLPDPDATFTLITQNVDGLSVRALSSLDPSPSPSPSPPPPPPGSDGRPLEMHGRVLATRCTRCAREEDDFSSPICEGLRGTESLQNEETVLPFESLPKCRECGGLLRPGVVWFGEQPKHLDEIYNEVLPECDLFLVVGTSSEVRLPAFLPLIAADEDVQVQPAASFAGLVQSRGGRVAVFNIAPSAGDEDADFLIAGPCEETLPALLEMPSSAQL